MDEDVFNMSVRKFLKKVGVTSQREIEKAVRDGIAGGGVQATGALPVKVELSVPSLGLAVTIDGNLELG